MTANLLHRKLFLVLATAIVTVCLLFVGMRVPDLTRPHRPKPSLRAVIENQHKISQYIVNNSIDFLAIPVKLPQIKTTLLYHTELIFTFYAPALPTHFPNPSRGPPTFLSR